MTYLYIAPNKEGTAFKMGFSKNPKNRLSAVDGNINYNKTYLFECLHMQSVETFCHKAYSEFRVQLYFGDGKNEWYDISIYSIALEQLKRNATNFGIKKHCNYYDIFNTNFKKKITPQPTKIIKTGKTYILSDSELTQLLNSTEAGNHGIRNRLLLEFTFYLGFSANDFDRLRIEDVANINGTVKQKINLKNRSVCLSNNKIRTGIENFIEFRKTSDASVFSKTSWLFKSQSGDVIRPNPLSRLASNIYTNNGYPDFTLFTGRRHFIINLINKGIAINKISEIVGHANVATTMKYITSDVEFNPSKIMNLL